jgi:SAM-dependent methyltransferase
MTGITLICPHDKAILQETNEGFGCEKCSRNYQIDEGVVRLLEHTDEFYEGAYENQVRYLPRSEKLMHIWPLWLINSGYPWIVRHHVPQGASVVELGCAGGVHYFGRHFRMIGCDLSYSSLKKLQVYEHRLQADAAMCIPLPDKSVDAVVSSYFWEHIPPELKPAMLRECHRILRPGGKIIFLYDVETTNPLIQYYKNKDQRLYKKLFIEGDGHLGYQRPQDNISAFKAAGFRVLEHRGLEKTWLQSPSAYDKLARFGGFASRLLVGLSLLGRQPWFYPYTAVMRLVDTVLCPWLPSDWARIDLVVAQKSAD